jgi:pilus assembly protein CpaE
MRTPGMNKNVLVLLIEEDPASIEPIRVALAHQEDRFRLQCVGSVATGLARIAGGGVNVVLLDLSLSRGQENERLGHFYKLRDAATELPIVVLCLAQEEALALSAVRAGAADYIIKERCATDLERLLQSVVERQHRPLDTSHVETSPARKLGTIITLLGVKGGVGTTTVALNVGSVLARQSKAIVAELRPTLGTLSQFFRPQGQTENVTCLLNREPAAIDEIEVASCLWPCRTIPGLSLLFGPQTMEQSHELGQAHAKAIFAMFARIADFIVVDLPAALTETNRAVIQASNVLALVVERDPICVQAAKMILQTIKSWTNVPPIGAIVVNRTFLNSSASIVEAEIELGLPIFGVIPPAPDICSAAQRARTALVAFDSESLVANSLTALAEKLANPGQTR